MYGKLRTNPTKRPTHSKKYLKLSNTLPMLKGPSDKSPFSKKSFIKTLFNSMRSSSPKIIGIFTWCFSTCKQIFTTRFTKAFWKAFTKNMFFTSFLLGQNISMKWVSFTETSNLPTFYLTQIVPQRFAILDWPDWSNLMTRKAVSWLKALLQGGTDLPRFFSVRIVMDMKLTFGV